MAEEIVIHEGNWQDHFDPPAGYSKGLVPRDFAARPQGYYAFAPSFDLPLIPESEQQARLDEQIARKARLSDIRNIGMGGKPIPSRDQNGKGYCWFHSGVSASLLLRAYMGEPYADLSAYAGACIIKHYADQGGNGIDGVEWQAENGCPTSEFWPQRSMSKSNDTPAMRANAKLHRITKWMDGESRNVQQLITCLLLCIPVVVDFNWWSHSVCAMDLVSINPLSIRIWNSWGDSWSENGTGILKGAHAVPDNLVMPRLELASAA